MHHNQITVIFTSLKCVKAFFSFLLFTIILSGCSSITNNLTKASFADDYNLAYLSPDVLREEGGKWEQKYRNDPENPVAAVAYSQYLRHLDESADAIKVMRLITLKHPQNSDVLKEYGKTLLKNGQFETALNIFERGRSPVKADWDLLNNMGIAYDHLGNSEMALQSYEQALELRPAEPRILANMGMSYALSGDIHRANDLLSQANAHPKATAKIRENYAVVQNILTKVAANPNGLPTLSPEQTASAVLSFAEKNGYGFIKHFHFE